MSAGTDEQFVRLLGDIDFSRPTIGRVPLPEPEVLTWKPLPKYEEQPEYDEDVHIAEDWEQAPPVLVQLLFQPQPAGNYDVQWLVEPGAQVAAGEPLARCYRTSDGLRVDQDAPFDLVVEEVLVKRNRRVVPGDALFTVAIPTLSLDLRYVDALVEKHVTRLAQSTNAVVKGIMGALGESGQVTDQVDAVEVRLQPENGYESLVDQIVRELAPPILGDGDIVIVSEKVIAIAQGRVFPLDLLYANDPKLTDRIGREELAEVVREHVADIDPDDLLCADVLAEQGLATAGVADPNGVAHDIAARLTEAHGVTCDVVITDTDTGLDVSEQLIGTHSLGATPLGATAGLVLYECMRVANAGEFVRGSHRGIPLVVCHVHPRRLRRDGLGQHRGYPGRLDASRERLLGFA